MIAVFNLNLLQTPDQRSDCSFFLMFCLIRTHNIVIQNVYYPNFYRLYFLTNQLFLEVHSEKMEIVLPFFVVEEF